MSAEGVQADFEEWMNREWPEWRHSNNALDVYRMRRAWESAYYQGRQDEAGKVEVPCCGSCGAVVTSGRICGVCCSMGVTELDLDANRQEF